jgi:hypothetical protein
MRLEDKLRRAEARGLARQARLPRSNRPSQRGRWLLCELGYLLVVLGARLEEYALSQQPEAGIEAKA